MHFAREVSHPGLESLDLSVPFFIGRQRRFLGLGFGRAPVKFVAKVHRLREHVVSGLRKFLFQRGDTLLRLRQVLLQRGAVRRVGGWLADRLTGTHARTEATRPLGRAHCLFADGWPPHVGCLSEFRCS
jgi:hypothetical protein